MPPAGDPVNNDTGVLGNGRTDSDRPYNSPAAGGTAQNMDYARSGTPEAPATAQGPGAGVSNQTPLHSGGGTNQSTGSPAGVDVGGAEKPAIVATGMPIWTETLEAVNALPERLVNFMREAELTRLGGPSSDPMPGGATDQNPDAPNAAKEATSAAGGAPKMEPGQGDQKMHWFFRRWGG